jgi:hypothetical protein
MADEQKPPVGVVGSPWKTKTTELELEQRDLVAVFGSPGGFALPGEKSGFG